MDVKYWNVYRTFFFDIVSSTSFPLFVIYLIICFNCYKWKKVADPLNFPKVKQNSRKNITKILNNFSKILFAYNVVISLVNVLCFFGFVKCLFSSKSLYDKSPDSLLKQVYFVYWMTKVVELCDTLFMILRHKFRQVSPLHVYHHATMLILSEMGYKKYAWVSIFPKFEMQH